jgi:hypothetical protein
MLNITNKISFHRFRGLKDFDLWHEKNVWLGEYHDWSSSRRIDREKVGGQILLSLEVSTVKTNRDRDRDFSICRDVLFQSVKIESLDRGKDKNQDKSRLNSIDFVEICRDVIFQTVKNFSTVNMSFFKGSRKS